MKVLDTCKVGGFEFAIIAEGKRVYEAVWNDEINSWDTDFNYAALGVDSFDVAGMMDFDGVEKQGYKFLD